MIFFKRIIAVIAAICVFIPPLAAQTTAQPDVTQLEEKLKTASLKEKIQLLDAFSEENIEKRPKLSLYYNREALRVAQEAGDPFYIATAIKNIGNWFYVTTQYTEALKHYLKALEYEPQLENKRFVANVLTNIGMVYWRLNQLKEAEKYQLRAVELRKKIGYSSREMGTTLINLGMVLHHQGRFDEALDYYRMAGDLLEKDGRKRQLAAVYNNIGELHLKTKAYSRALENFGLALKIYESLGHKWGVANSKRNFGEVYIEMKNYGQARRYFESALEHAKIPGFRTILMDSYIGLSTLYKAQGDFKKSLEYHEKYVKIHDRLDDEEKTKLKGVLKAAFDDRQKDNRIKLLLQKQKNERLVIYSLVAAVLAILIILAVLLSRTREHKRLEHERVRAAKLETVQLLSGGIAHDFNNLLAVLNGNLEMAVMETRPEAGIRKYLDQAEIAAHSAASLAKKFLTISNSGFGNLEKIEVGKFVRDTVQHTLDKIGGPVDLRFHIPGEPGMVEGDVTQLRRALENLVHNAVESIGSSETGDEDGWLEVHATVRKVANGDVPALAVGNYAVISFKDNGEGILPGNLPRIFDPYFSTREDFSRKGLGMGLALAQSVVKRHDGAITVASQPGEGSVFTIYLPLSGSRQ